MKRKSEKEQSEVDNKKIKIDSDDFEKRLAFLQPFAQRKVALCTKS